MVSFAGKLFGTAATDNSQPCRSEFCATVFALAPGEDGWTEKILHSFPGGDGIVGAEGLVADPRGNLYGTTFVGGASGNGTIFKIDPEGQKTTLHNFDGKDGAHPFAALIRDSSGNLFGTATAGGASDEGTVFRLDPENHLTVLHNFKGGKTDGAAPYGTLLLVGKTLYGTTAEGGPKNAGTVFELSD